MPRQGVAFADESPTGAGRRYRSVFAGVPAYLFALDRNGIFTLCDGRGLSPSWLDGANALGRSAIDAAAGADLVDRDGKTVSVAAAIHRALGGDEVGGLCPSGDLVFDLRMSPQIDEVTGNPDGVVGLFTDVTARVRAERALRETQEALTEREQIRSRLLASDRMAALGTLAAGAAHEINNPMTYLSLNTEHVLRELRALSAKSGEPGMADLDEMVAALTRSMDGAKRIGEIVHNLSLFARGGGAERRAVVDVRGVLESAIQMASHELLYRARIVRHLADVPPVFADATSLGQVFIHLLLNAAQSIDEGDATNNEVLVTTMADEGGNAVVEIADTGCGIHPAALPRVFDPFFTVKSTGGTGLGLSISHGTVKSLGGEITVTSTPGIGSTFRVVLPPCLALRGPPAPADDATTAGTARTRVLVIDDEELIREAIWRALGKECSVTLAASGREALALLSDESRGYDIILCDLLMPDVSGMDLYSETIRAAPALGGRFVFMTGGAFTPKARSFLENVGNPHLEKPIALAKLREIVRSSRSPAR